MRKLIALILIWSQVSYAGLPPTSIQGQSDASPKTKFNFQAPFNQITDLGGIKSLIETGNTNILQDPGFESAVSGWTASGGATATSNSTAKGTGALGYDWDSNSAGQTLTSSLVTIPAGLQGKNGVISCAIKTVSGTATHTLGVWDGTTLSSAQTITSSTTSFADTKINFIFPSSGSVAIRATSVNANEPEVYIDDCAIKLADNITQISQAVLLDSVKITGCSGSWSQTSTVYASAGGSPTGCVYTSTTGACGAPDTNLPAVKCTSIAAGTYGLDYEGSISVNATQTLWVNAFDGVLSASEESQFSTTSGGQSSPGVRQTIRETAPKSNVTFQFRSKVNTGTANMSGTTANPSVIRVWYFPSSSQQAVSSANADYDWTAYTPTFSAGLGTVSPATVTIKHKRIADTLQIRGNFTIGTVAASLASFTLPTGLSVDTTKLSGASTNQFVGTAITDLATVSSTKGATILASPSNSSTSLYMSLQDYAATGSALTPKNGSAIFANNSVVSVDISVPISGWSGNQRAPTLVGSVTSSSINALRIESIAMSSSGVASKATTPSWLSCTAQSGGASSCTFAAGTFSSQPSCFINDTQTGSRFCVINTYSGTTGFNVQCYVNGTTGDNNAYEIMCLGNR